MKWLWFVGPLIFLLISLLVGIFPTAEQRNIRRSIQRWIDDLLGPLQTSKGDKTRRVRQLPAMFDGLLEAIGGGTRLTDLVLVPKNAYVAVRLANATTASNHVSVMCRLKGKANPRFVCRPLPIVDGRAIENAGVIFSGDDEFQELFLVEGAEPKAIKKWFTRDLRDALLELPDCWLRVDGDAMSLTVFGYRELDTLDELVGVADAFYAEKGATGHSLYGENDPSLRPKKEPTTYRDRAGNKTKGKTTKTSDAELVLANAALRMKAGALDIALYVLGGFLVALTLGVFAWFHPSVLFNSPDVVVQEAWQGGWTTKGFGAFVAAETFLVGTFAYQTYLGATYGQSIGKRLFGARVVRADGEDVDFLRGVLLRTWVLGVLPYVAAAIFAAKVGFSARSFFEAIPTIPVFGVGAVVLGIGALSISVGRGGLGIHDRIARTKVVVAAPFRLEPVQLGIKGVDPILSQRVLWGVVAMLLLIIANVIGAVADIGFWIY
jgi:uncharacterized RDD family membrane protein YckC